MKLLLTSSGITNDSIAKALLELANKAPGEINIAFVPTAANVEPGDKDWLINDLSNLVKQNYKSIDIVDFSAVGKDVWLPRLQAADILFFGGGNTFHLMRCLKKYGLADLLPELLKTRVYVGISAGSTVTNKDLFLRTSQILYGDDLNESENLASLNFVDFYFLPHLNSEYFPKLRKKNIEEAITGISEKVYALDDNSALKVVDGQVEIISEGKYFVFNEK